MRDEDREALISDIRERFGILALAAYAQRLEDHKRAIKAFKKNEPTMYPDEQREARLALNADLFTIQHELQSYLVNRGDALEEFYKALREVKRTARTYYETIQGVLDAITTHSERNGLTFEASPPEADFSAEVQASMIDESLDKWLAEHPDPLDADLDDEEEQP
jgi:hypothetical protein